jgi:hypothetical protein
VVGLVSRERAEWLGMAAAVAGGAVYADCPWVEGVHDGADGERHWPALLAVGALPSGEPVADLELLDPALVIVRLSERRARLAALAEHHECVRDEADALAAVLADLRGRLG